MNETGLTKNQIITELSRSPHGNLAEYIPMGRMAATQHPEFFAHLVAWDRLKGQVRNAKVALPIISLLVPDYPEEFIENSLAHLSQLGPREMLQAYRFAVGLHHGQVREIVKTEDKQGHITKTVVMRDVPVAHLRSMAKFTDVLGTALLEREKNWPRWERTMLQHRETLRELLALLHVQPRDERTIACLHQQKRVGKENGKWKYEHLPYPHGGLFELVSQLKDMPPQEAAGHIIQKKLPFLVVLGALGKKAQDTDLVLALINSMTPTELVTNTRMLEKMGVKTNPALRGAFQEALAKAGKSTANLLKATTAAEAMDDEELKENLLGLQEKQIQAHGGVEGDWLVLADKSGSMSFAIDTARQVAATLAKMVKGKVWLVFFDTSPQSIDVTGASLDAIKKATQYITAGGGTSIGCGLMRMLESNLSIDGIAIVSDGGDNTVPFFHQVYGPYSEKFGKAVPTYLYECDGEPNALAHYMREAGHDLQIFNLRGSRPDSYSLPNLVSSMRTNRYSLADEILATRLLTLPDAYKTKLNKTAHA